MGLLDIIGALTNASRTEGGIQTMPNGTLGYAPMRTSKPGLDMLLTGGRGRAQTDQFNNQVLAAILQQQMANKGQIEAIGAQGTQNRLNIGETGSQNRLTNEQATALQKDLDILRSSLELENIGAQGTQNRLNIVETGTQNRLTNEQATKLQREIEEMRAEIARKAAILQQGLGEASKLGVTVRGDQDLDVMAQALNDPNIRSALQRTTMLGDVMTSDEGKLAHKQNVLATLQAPAIQNTVAARMQTPPATIQTMPEVSKEGMVNIANQGRSQTGLIPYAEQTQQMITLPGGEQYPGKVIQHTGYRSFGNDVEPRPKALKQATSSTTMPATMPTNIPGVTDGDFGTGTSFFQGMPSPPPIATMPQGTMQRTAGTVGKTLGNAGNTTLEAIMLALQSLMKPYAGVYQSLTQGK